jgi:hypothetical protein
MWIIVAIVIISSWLYFLAKARPLARTIDRAEVIVLKPLTIAYVTLALAFGISGAWIMVLCAMAALLVNGAIGASLHLNRNFDELADGTLQYMRKGLRAEVSHAESRAIARSLIGAGNIFAFFLFAVLLHIAIPWYIALPTAIISASLLIVACAVLAAYQAIRAKDVGHEPRTQTEVKGYTIHDTRERD